MKNNTLLFYTFDNHYSFVDIVIKKYTYKKTIKRCFSVIVIQTLLSKGGTLQTRKASKNLKMFDYSSPILIKVCLWPLKIVYAQFYFWDYDCMIDN